MKQQEEINSVLGGRGKEKGPVQIGESGIEKRSMRGSAVTEATGCAACVYCE